MKFRHRMFAKIEQKIKNNTASKWYFSLFGIFAIAWVLIRILPKPSRATYPCMKVAFPLATSFVIYITGMVSSVFLFKKARIYFNNHKYTVAIMAFLLALSAGVFSLVNEQNTVSATTSDTYDFEDPLGPNQPIGEAKGILPGRVVWVHNPNATNENCNSKKYGDGYFLDKNCNQLEVDRMLAEALLQLTGKTSETEAWNAVFKHFNSNHNKGEIGFSTDETIFIKYNAVHAWSVNSDLSIKNDDSYGNVDTSPQAILAMLRQLVNVAGVPQENIFIGDPFTHVFKHCYDKWSAEFPNINYITKYNKKNRYQITETNEGQIIYSDKGTAMEEVSDKYYSCHIDADYILNIPALKGHRWGGVTFFAKNHFGTHTRGSSYLLHPGLHREDYNLPIRGDYKQYRVMVDLMGHEHLGGKTLLYFGDLLWGTSYEHDPPMKFRMEPFNNDWSSSILLSFDPVAIESVALDIYQAEIVTEDLNTNPPRYAYVRFPAVDDYLHQAASSDWWPEGIQYDPEGDGTAIPSLGVHEHWNANRQYSRNLGTGNGIELVTVSQLTMLPSSNHTLNQIEVKYYPNPVLNELTVEMKEKGVVSIYSLAGIRLFQQTINETTTINIGSLEAGTYLLEFNLKGRVYTQKLTKE